MELFTIVFLFGFVCAGDYINDDLRRIDSICQERDCTSAGGMCVVAADCPHNNLAARRGLCPQQQRQGIECCHGMSVKETRCRKRGGECLTIAEGACRPSLRDTTATDCDEGTVCCILV